MITNGRMPYILDVGSHSNVAKCVDAALDIVCPASHSSQDPFLLRREGTQICVRRADSNPGGWGEHLQVPCTSGNPLPTTSSTSGTTRSTTSTATTNGRTTTASTADTSSTTSVAAQGNNSSSDNGRAQAALALLEQESAEDLGAFRDGAKDIVSNASPTGTIHAVRMSEVVLDNATAAVAIPVPEESGVEIKAHPSFFSTGAFADRALQDTAAVVRVFNSSGIFEDLGGGERAWEVFAVVAIDFRGISTGKVLKVEGLTTPVQISLPAAHRPGMVCAFWDNHQGKWSRDGVETDIDSVPGEPIKCLTTHFSLFGAIMEGIVKTASCANFDLINAEAVANVFKGSWYGDWGAIACECLLILNAAIMAAAACRDRRLKKCFAWSDEFFLIEALEDRALPTTPATPADAESPDTAAQPEQSLHTVAAGNCGSCLAWCKSSDGVRDAVDDICSRWFEYFGEVRAFLEELKGYLTGANEPGSVAALPLKITTHLSLMTSYRVVASKMGVSDDVLEFVVDDKDLADFLVDSRVPTQRNSTEPPERHSASRNGEWRLATNQREAWHMLHDEITHRLATAHLEKAPMWKSILHVFLTCNPVGAAFVLDVFKSSKQRVLLLGAQFWGALALSCVFFEASGAVKGKKQQDCDLDSESLEEAIGLLIGRGIVIAAGSLLIAALPILFLESLQTKGFKTLDEKGSRAWMRQLRIWAIQERIFWGFGSCYTLICLLYVTIFLANIGVEDHGSWSLQAMITVAEDFALMPFFSTAVLPCMAKAFLKAHICWTRSDEDTFHRQALMLLRRRNNMLLPITHV